MGKKKRPTPVPAPFIGSLFDAHTHLGLSGADSLEETREIMLRAVEAGVAGVCTVGDGLEETEQAVALAQEHPRIWSAVAIHPTRAHEVTEPVKERLATLAADPRCVAIGETGLDTYWIGRSEDCAPLDVQRDILAWHVELACSLGKPLMIHNREADKELFETLDSLPQPPAVILHCFSSPISAAEEALSRDYILSFSGNITFKNNDHIRQAAAIAPAGNILIETDAPCMPPEPFRGIKNEPQFIGYTAYSVAEQRGMMPAEVAALTMANAQRVYGIDEVLEVPYP